MQIVNVHHTTGTVIAHGLRDDCFGKMMDIRPLDAPDYIPTGSHIGRPALFGNGRLYVVYAEDHRMKPF
jgi:hypothetical protein